MKTSTLVILTMLSVGINMSYSAPKEGLPNGKPFRLIEDNLKTLEQGLEEVREMAEDNEAQIVVNTAAIASLEQDVLDLETEIALHDGENDTELATLRSLISNNRLLIAQLQAEVDLINEALDTGCPNGFAIKQVVEGTNVSVCESVVTTSSGDVIRKEHRTNWVELAPGQLGYVYSYCTDGWEAIGHGWTGPVVSNFHVHEFRPWNLTATRNGHRALVHNQGTGGPQRFYIWNVCVKHN